MSEWKVSIEKIEVFPHPNADKMELAKVGSFQLVVGKGMYHTGDLVAFAPQRSVLPWEIRDDFRNEETGQSYLRGPESNRVGAIRLRGELSEGVTLSMIWVMKKLRVSDESQLESYLGQDISKELGIEEYSPEHSAHGHKTRSVDGSATQPVREAIEMKKFVRHDCEQFRIYQNEFVEGEQVLVTEKLHGSQISILKDRHERIAVTSKGRGEKNLVLRKYPRWRLWQRKGFFRKVENLFRVVFSKYTPEINQYWKYAIDSGIIEFLEQDIFRGQEVQVVGEVVPVQKGYTYGRDKHIVKVFRLVWDTNEMPYGSFAYELSWVPLLYKGEYRLEKILPLAEGKETVSGRSLHPREGCVLSPVPLRKAKDNTWLYVKLVSKKFKEDPNGEEIR